MAMIQFEWGGKVRPSVRDLENVLAGSGLSVDAAYPPVGPITGNFWVGRASGSREALDRAGRIRGVQVFSDPQIGLAGPMSGFGPC